MGVTRRFKKTQTKKWYRYTDRDSDLKTESAKWADAVKRKNVYIISCILLWSFKDLYRQNKYICEI